MPTRKEVTDAVERVRDRREEYGDAGREGADASQQYWDALRETPGDEREEAISAANTRVSSTDAATQEAFEALGKELIDMHSMKVDERGGVSRQESPRE